MILNQPTSILMPLLNLSPLLFLNTVLLSISTLSNSSSPFPTIAISHVTNQTVICALFPSYANTPYELNCTSFPNRGFQSYPSGGTLYSAIAAGNGFLCGLGSPRRSSNVVTMRWWEFTHRTRNSSIPDSKRVYIGSPLSMLAAGDSHVCGILGNTGDLKCWRWPELSLPTVLSVTTIAVGGDFVCGLLDSGVIRCFGNDTRVVGKEPAGNYSIVAAGSRHACGISNDGRVVCWGSGAPEFGENLYGISSIALGEDRTCARRTNGTVLCWGVDDFNLPENLVHAQFMAIEAKGSTFCGILMANYSLVCWGSDIFHQNHVVFNRVLPGSCTVTSTCSCGVLPGSGDICANGGGICNQCKLKSNANPPSSQPNSTQINGHRRRLVLLIIVGSIGLVVAMVAVFSLFRFWVGRNTGQVHDSGRLDTAVPTNERHSSFVHEFSLQLLVNATDRFSEGNKIGSGSFGAVYRATLDGGRVVAIKRAEPSTAQDRRRDRESAFRSELALLSRVNHKNLVRLLGFCNAGAERVLVYEYVTNGNLHDHLHKLPGSPVASWGARIRVALDAARGIEYLHAYAVPPIIHRDIKSSNILLDESWTAKVSDFGLSLANNGEESHGSLRAAGTVGYMDPEYYRIRHLTTKSDVYSFGVVLLELLSGKPVIDRYEDSDTPRNVVEFAVPLIEAGEVERVLDRRLPSPTPGEAEAVAYVGYLASYCVSQQGRDRPTMTEIVGVLERALAACLAPWSTKTRSV